MSHLIPVEILSISTNTNTNHGSIDNILIWDSNTYWLSGNNVKNPSFTVSSISPLYIHKVELMSRERDAAYPKSWKLEATTQNGEKITLLENKPGLCDGNSYKKENYIGNGIGLLCSSTTITKYIVNSNIPCKTITFTSLNRSHNYNGQSNLDISSIRFFGSLWPIKFCSACLESKSLIKYLYITPIILLS